MPKKIILSFSIPILWLIKFGLTPQFIGLLPLAFVSLELIRNDIKFFKLPNRLIFTTFLITLIYITCFSISQRNGKYFSEPIFMFLIYFSVGLIFYTLSSNSFGAGDVKLMGLIGLNLGFFSMELALLAALIAFGSLLVFAAALLISRRATATSRIPFGPFLVISTLISITLFG